MVPLMLLLTPASARLIRFGYFAEAQTLQVACARGLFDFNGDQVVCLPQSSGGYAVAKLDQGDLDLAVLGSTPWATAISRGVELKGFYIAHSKGDSQGLVTHERITTPLELHGKVIATPFGSTAHQHMLFLRTIFGSRVSFSLVNHPCSQALLQPLWDSGAIDGAFCWGAAFAWLRSVGKGLLTARTLARWGVETFNIVAATQHLATQSPAFLEHVAGVMAALDQSWVSGLDINWHPSEPSGYVRTPGVLEPLDWPKAQNRPPPHPIPSRPHTHIRVPCLLSQPSAVVGAHACCAHSWRR